MFQTRRTPQPTSRYTVTGRVTGIGVMQHVIKADSADAAKTRFRRAYSKRAVDQITWKKEASQ